MGYSFMRENGDSLQMETEAQQNELERVLTSALVWVLFRHVDAVWHLGWKLRKEKAVNIPMMNQGGEHAGPLSNKYRHY